MLKVLLVVALVGSAPSIFAQCDQGDLTPPDGGGGDEFSYAVSVAGDLAVVGSPNHGTFPENRGAAYVYRFDGSGWSLEQKLAPTFFAAGDRFGAAVAIAGENLLIGAPEAQSGKGALVVFRRDGGDWVPKQVLFDPASDLGDRFGAAVAADGSVAIVGVPGDDVVGTDAGSAVLFRFDGEDWALEQKIGSSGLANSDSFGQVVSIRGDVAAVGVEKFDAPGVGIDAGGCFVFRRSNGTWSLDQTLSPADHAPFDRFGAAVDVSADRVLIGSPNDDDQGSTSGSAYVFSESGGTWIEEQKLIPSDGAVQDQFGRSVAIDGTALVIGAWLHDDGGRVDSGAAYVFRRGIDGWVEQLRLLADAPETGDRFGSSVALDRETTFVGAPLRSGSSPVGAASVDGIGSIAGVAFGAGCAGPGGVGSIPILSAFADGYPGGVLGVRIRQAIPTSDAFLVFGLEPGNLSMGFGCTLNVQPLLPGVVGPLPVPASGELVLGAPIEVQACLVIDVTVQGFLSNPYIKRGFSNTNGLELRFR